MDPTVRAMLENELGDGKVAGISWTEEDLIIHVCLQRHGHVARDHVLLFTMVSGVRIDLDYGVYVGQPLIFSVTADEIDNDRWKVRFEFGAAPDGSIEFECSDIRESSPARRAT